MSRTRHIAAAGTLVLLGTLSMPAAHAASYFTPRVEAGGMATDNAGERPDELGRRSDVTATASAGGRFVFSRPLWSVRADGMAEMEQYLSAAIRNVRATGAAVGKWRPDERTYVRTSTRASYSPDRYEPRVPYRLALETPAGEELSPFYRATTARWSQSVGLEHRRTERHRLGARLAVGGTRYSGRRLSGPDGEPIDERVLQSRTVWQLGGESLWALRETLDAGVFAEGARADYEVSRDAWTATAGGALEWRIAERLEVHLRTGPSWTTVPGSRHLPDRLGYTADASVIRRWVLAELELRGREGIYLADATIPAARRRDARLTLRLAPFERVTFEGWAGAGTETSQYEAYHATGTARMLTAGATVAWRVTEHLTARTGYEHTNVEASGRVELPFRSNVVFFGLSLGGWNFGSPAPEANP